MRAVNFRASEPVRHALDEGRPVVALESTVITHGLPRPQNLELARDLERTVREAGAVPATVGVVAGEPVVGLDDAELERLAGAPAEKASLWNLAAVLARGENAGTTVAATLRIAAAAGLRVFATGGIGGVHDHPFDESADLQALARYPLVTVCAGPKSILDQEATLERLESLGVPVIGYRSDTLAGFHVPLTDLPLPVRCDDPDLIAEIARRHARDVGGGIVVSNPVSEGLSREELEGWTARARAEAEERGVRGRRITPYLLQRLAELSAGRTVEANLRLLRENAALASRIAAAPALRGAPPREVPHA